MHVSAKKISFLGLLLALTVLLNVLSSVIETSTLFFLAAASFLVGIAFRETNKIMGSGFYLASLLLNFILAPNKIYVITFGAISLYIVLFELLKGNVLLRITGNKIIQIYIVKFLIFNLIFVPILVWFPKLIITRELSDIFYLLFFIGGQIVFLIYDKAYDYFVTHYWNRYRRNFNL